LDGLTLDLNTTISGYATAINGLTLNNRTITLTNANFPELKLSGAQTLGGSGTILFSTGMPDMVGGGGGSNFAVIGSGITVRCTSRLGGTVVSNFRNQGSITSS